MNASLAPFLALALAAPLEAQNVWTVAQTGGADFFEPQAAVDAASDGDLIYVTGGAYTALSIDGKSVTLQATGIVSVTSLGFFTPDVPGLSVSNLAPNQTVVLRGFQVGQLGYFDGHGALLTDNAGAVVFEDCLFHGNSRPFEASNCASVTLVDSTVTAPKAYLQVVDGDPIAAFTYDGIAADDSALWLYDCEVAGGAGRSSGQASPGSDYAAIDAGHAVRLTGSTLFASGGQLLGGTGPDSFDPFCSPGSAGGSGVLVDAFSHADLLDCATLGGSGGAGACDGPAGLDGFGVQPQIGGTFTELPGLARRGTLDAVTTEGALFSAELRGAPGDQVFAAISSGFSQALALPWGATYLHLQAGFELLPLGVLPASGIQSASFFAPALPGTSLARVFATQFLFFDGAFHEGGPTQMLVIQAP
jgi:hypothetical protein